MANTSSQVMMQTLTNVVQYANGTGSVSLYMAHGGTNFGYWAGVLAYSSFPSLQVAISTLVNLVLVILFYLI